ncbi:MAG: response regulator [Chloroflexi bacterium]|nr:response regulator [Chloroflexota bacterium]
MDGLTAIEKLHATHPQIGVIILATFNEDDLMLRGLQAGARGYLLKDTDRAALFDTIRAAARGETLLKPEIMSRVLTYAGAVSQLDSFGPTFGGLLVSKKPYGEDGWESVISAGLRKGTITI